jgi:hypothetical protein
VEGPGYNLDKNYHYFNENALIFIVVRKSNINVALVNIFERHENLWMDGGRG